MVVDNMADSGSPERVKKKESFFAWAFFTLFLPLLPVLLKVLLSIFGKQGDKQINILDSTELLYYSFIVSVVILYSFFGKEIKAVVEGLICFAAFNVAWTSIAMLIMVYVDYQRGQWIHWASIGVTVLMIITACANKHREDVE